jgi:glycosyltransferase involved in cell wall biosynthesis
MHAMTAARRVLYTIPNLDTAGSGAALLAVARRLDRYQPTIAVRQRRGTALEAAVDAAGIELVEAEVTVPARPYGGLRRRARQAQAPRGFDLWHSFHYLDDYTEPLVARAAGCRRWVFTKKNMAWDTRAWRLRRRLAAGVAVQNPTMVDAFFPRFRGPLRVIPPGVDTDRYSPGTGASWRTELGLGDDDVLVANVAHLLPNKGQLDLVRALPDNAHLVLAGRPLDEAYAAEVARQASDRVHVVGPVDDVADLLRASDVFAFASAQEACPVAVIEAMSTGLPVVVTDIPGTRHLVDDGVQGRRVERAALGDALAGLVGDPGARRAMGEAARRRVLDELTVEREVAAYQDLYDAVLAR